jgi:hypothetical protein
MTQKIKLESAIEALLKLQDDVVRIEAMLTDFNDCEGCVAELEQGENSLCGHCSRSFNDMWRTE